MCEYISEAAENLNRNQITSMALDKIEEKEIVEKNFTWDIIVDKYKEIFK